MVDCDLFTDFNRELIQEKNKILLDYKNCDYTVELYCLSYPGTSLTLDVHAYPAAKDRPTF